MGNFIPEQVKPDAVNLPFFEDSSREKGIAGHGTDKTLNTLMAEVRVALGRLGGSVTDISPGKWDEKPSRFGYRVLFQYHGMPGRFDVAALPMRKETPDKKEKAQKQALWMLARILESEYHKLLLQPGAAPLVPYLIDDQGRTLTEALVETGRVPQLRSGS